ncbi:putative pentatricopeptide repeat-containing protein At3g18840 [Malania oleifera]|uniref:putative pentatricopeptide repeat-containing protein At3g18840 n=1 Tax=Malania oleifera TaxID=397392 RepID=UPI0025AE71F4|nr:putative pentatricopeptide repeat-containing protein At3g18840 [Malania oleifera]
MRSLKDGLRLHGYAVKAGFTPTIFTCNQLIHLYANHGLLREAHKLFDEMPERNVFTWNAIISAHVRNQDLGQAQVLFESAPCKDIVTYNSMLSGYVSTDGYEFDAVKLFVEMQTMRDGARFDEFTLTTMLNLTAKLSELSYGRQLHSFMVKTANDSNGFAMSSLVDMYSKCGCFREAHQVFDHGGDGVLDLVSKNAMIAACCREGEMEMAENLFWRNPELNDTVSWNTMISGFEQNGCNEESLKLFVHMLEKGIGCNEHTLASVLSACSGLKSLKLGKEVHARVLKEGLSLNSFISSGIVDVYCKCGHMKYAESVHAATGMLNSFSVTSMIVGHSSQGYMVEARRLFDSLEEKNSVVWTALFSGYVKLKQCEAVFELLSEFRAKEAVVPDALIVISAIGACAIQAALDSGKQIHSYILRMGIEMDDKLVSAMVDMYSKCGNITYAERIFRPVTERDSVLYNVMIAGHAHHGQEKQAILLFEEMLERGIKPDAVTFLALLSACRHGGLVEVGEKYFYSMIENYAISPEIDHYSCMIDLYGKANQLQKAATFMKRIPVQQDAVIWGAFLNACKINRNVEFAREAEEKLLQIESDNGARYVQLANVYAAEGYWDEMARVRRKMRGTEVKKFAGCSWVYVENRVHVFISGGTSHPQAEAIYSLLYCLSEELN